MKVCFPVKDDRELDSEVYGHFGSAPAFVMVDTDTNKVSVITNNNQQHEKGACNPVGALGPHNVDGLVVGGIGGGALMKLNQAGIVVFKAMAQTVGDNLDLLKSRQLPVFQPGQVCGGHGHGGGCSHG